MNKLPYKILMISWDATLAMDDPKFGDAKARHAKYGQYVDQLHIITYSKKPLHLTKKKLAGNVWVYPTDSINAINFLPEARKIAENIQQQSKIDLVVTQDPFLTGSVGVWFKKKFGAKLLVHFHGDFWRNPLWLKEKWYNRFLDFLMKRVLEQSDAIRTMSQGQKKKFVEFGLPAGRIKVISTPVDINKFAEFNKRELLNSLTTDRKVILMVGRKDKVKDFKTLFNAIKLVYQKNKNIELRLVGNYKRLKKYKFYLPKNLSVMAIGEVKNDDLPAYYKTSYLTVLSSTSESFGKVLVEANACAKPVVATATTGAKEIIQDGVNGYLVPIKDYQALADKILYLLDNPDKAKELGTRGQQLVKEKFADNTERIINFWQDIIENKL